MLRHFPRMNVAYVHRRRDYVIGAFTFLCVALSSMFEVSASMQKQYAMGAIAWAALGGLLLGESKETRMQVVIAVLFATIGEHFASLYMGGYTYRFENVPAYVPPGHGMVYLTAIALARSGLFVRYAREIASGVVLLWGAWSLWGISEFAEQRDSLGAVLFGVFMACLLFGRSPMVYLAAFFITTWLEILGTAVGAWKWAAIDPVLGLSQGNPPSGVAAWYCLVDAVAIGGAAPSLRGVRRAGKWCQSWGYSGRTGRRSVLGALQGRTSEEILTPMLPGSEAIHPSLKNRDLTV